MFPGLGMGVIVARAPRVTDEVIVAAGRAVAGEVNVSLPGTALLPPVAEARVAAAAPAVAVVKVALESGQAQPEIDNLIEAVRREMWWPRCSPIRAV